jgi:serine/threonine protein kinase
MRVGNYEIKRELGRGTFGVTFLAYDILNARNVAVKTIDINKSKQLGADLTSIKEEVQTLNDLSTGDGAKYIAQYYDSFLDELGSVPTIFIISEYVDGSSLTSFIEENAPNVPPKLLWDLYLQLFLGLKHIHDSGYAHRDIKPDNILITKDLRIKYIDFGLACLAKCKMDMCTNKCRGRPGTIYYMPPEFFNGTFKPSLESAKAHDIWSLTMVLWELTNGLYKFPYQLVGDNGRILDDDQLTKSITRPIYSSNYQLDDGTVNDFLNYLVVVDWQARPSIDDIITISSQIIKSSVLTGTASRSPRSRRLTNVARTVPYVSRSPRSFNVAPTVPYVSRSPRSFNVAPTVPYVSRSPNAPQTGFYASRSPRSMSLTQTASRSPRSVNAPQTGFYASRSPRSMNVPQTVPYVSRPSSPRSRSPSYVSRQTTAAENIFLPQTNNTEYFPQGSRRSLEGKSVVPKPSEIGKNLTFGFVDITIKQ